MAGRIVVYIVAMNEQDFPNLSPEKLVGYLRDEIDALPLVRTLHDRVSLVAGNMVVASETIIEDFGENYQDWHHLREKISTFGYHLEGIRTDAERSPSDLYKMPLLHTAQSLQRFRCLLDKYTPYIPAIFDGYTPVSPHVDWADRLGNESVRNFGRHEERLILLAGTMAAEGSYAIDSYPGLEAEGVRRGEVARSNPHQ
jgi:hypothetical protein